MDEQEARQRFSAAQIARLATVRPDGAPHVVPVVFALAGDELYVVVDHKPKRTHRLQRLVNLRAEPRCSLLVDHYEADWSALWWVRADGVAAVVDEPDAEHPGLQALSARHHTYRVQPPDGPLIIVTVSRWSGWSGTPS